MRRSDGTLKNAAAERGRRHARRHFVRTLGAAVAWATLTVAILPGAATAQVTGAAFPSRPIRLIVGYTPGGGADIMGRLIGNRLSIELGQPVVVENKPGAGQNIGASFVARAPADGYTLFLSSSALAVNASLYPTLDYDPVKSFTPVALFARAPNLMVVPRVLGVQTVQQFIAYARANPDKVNFSSSGNGSTQHLSGELFNRETGLKVKHIPYRGSAPSITAVGSNETQLTFINIPSVLGQLTGDKLRALAITSNSRSPLLPDVPTMAEAGVKNMDIAAWYGVLAPAGTPADVVARIHAAIDKATSDADFRKQIESSGAEVVAQSSDWFARYLVEDIDRWRPIIRGADVKPE